MGDVDTNTEAVTALADRLSDAAFVALSCDRTDDCDLIMEATALIAALIAERDEARAEAAALRSVVDGLLADSEIVERDSVGPGVGQQRRTWEAKDRIRAIRKAWQTAEGGAPAAGTDGGA